MPTKNIFLFFIYLILQQPAFTQSNSPATQVGSKMVTGSFVLSSLGGERYTGSSDKKITAIGTEFDYLTFFSNKFAAGPKAAFGYRKDNNYTQYTVNLGPKAAYYFDNGSNNIPYLGASLSYLFQRYKFSNQTFKVDGLQGDFSGGLAIRKKHLLVLLEAGYTYQKAKNNNTNTTESASAFYLSIGFRASLY